MGGAVDWDLWVKDTFGVDPKLSPSRDAGPEVLPDPPKPLKKKDVLTPDYEQDGRGSPYHQTVPDAFPPDPKPPTILKSPTLTWDFPKGEQAPKPAPPNVPLAADSKAVSAAIAGIDDSALVPDSARGKPEAGDYPSAHEVARTLADQIDSARLAKSKRVDFALRTQYPTPEANKAALDRIEAIVKAVAATLPDRGAPVTDVVIGNVAPAGHSGQGWGKTIKLEP